MITTWLLHDYYMITTWFHMCNFIVLISSSLLYNVKKNPWMSPNFWLVLYILFLAIGNMKIYFLVLCKSFKMHKCILLCFYVPLYFEMLIVLCGACLLNGVVWWTGCVCVHRLHRWRQRGERKKERDRISPCNGLVTVSWSELETWSQILWHMTDCGWPQDCLECTNQIKSNVWAGHAHRSSCWQWGVMMRSWSQGEVTEAAVPLYVLFGSVCVCVLSRTLTSAAQLNQLGYNPE